MSPQRILIAFECSGRVRAACRALGHEAWSCDLKPAEDGHHAHLQRDVREVLRWDWDAILAFPDCTYLAVSGLHRNICNPKRAAKTVAALALVREVLEAPAIKIALENPIGCIGTRITPPTQIIQPYDFGEDASKATCLWLKGLPRLQPTKRVHGRLVEFDGLTVERWANQTDSGQNRLGPSPTRAADRARTYQGIANAMAQQWFGPESWRSGLPLFDTLGPPEDTKGPEDRALMQHE